MVSKTGRQSADCESVYRKSGKKLSCGTDHTDRSKGERFGRRDERGGALDCLCQGRDSSPCDPLLSPSQNGGPGADQGGDGVPAAGCGGGLPAIRVYGKLLSFLKNEMRRR